MQQSIIFSLWVQHAPCCAADVPSAFQHKWWPLGFSSTVWCSLIGIFVFYSAANGLKILNTPELHHLSQKKIYINEASTLYIFLPDEYSHLPKHQSIQIALRTVITLFHFAHFYQIQHAFNCFFFFFVCFFCLYNLAQLSS